VYAAEAPDGGAREIAVLARPAVPDDLEGLIARAASVVAASRVRHPALAAVEDAGIAADGRLFVVTAWVSGATLEEALHAHGATGARTALRIALRAAEGLSAAHAAGLVHGELAPARIRVGVPAPGGWEPAVTVTGLGLRLARSTGAAPQKDRRPYVAPEQWTGAGVSPAADVFALASITLAALSGKRPRWCVPSRPESRASRRARRPHRNRTRRCCTSCRAHAPRTPRNATPP
jgi:serine/threonine protein kinase